MAPSFSVISWWEGGGRGDHRLSPRKPLASFCRALICLPQAKLKGTRLQPGVWVPALWDRMFILLHRRAPRSGHPWYVNMKGIKLAHLCARWQSRDLPQCEYVRVGTYVGAVGFMCVCGGEVVPMKTGWQCLQLCAQVLPQLALP